MTPKKIAILSSTKPLRKPVLHGGHEMEALGPDTIMSLAAKFDMVIMGSEASEKVYEMIRESLPLRSRSVLKSYSRQYFEEFTGGRSAPADQRAQGLNQVWQMILKENHIQYENRRKVILPTGEPSVREFDAKELEAFVGDPRVVFIKSREQILALP